MDQALTQSATPRPNWWRRNWKWFVPLGCFTVALLFLAFVGSGHEDRIFNLNLPANPMKSKYRNWSGWQKPDFVAKADEQPTGFPGGNDYQIRYRVDYQDR